jgi:hypothetical protein
MAISGPATNLFAASNFGKVYRSTDGTNFTRVLSAGRDLLSVYVAPNDGSVFLASGPDIGVCRTSPCTAVTSFSWIRPAGTDATTSWYALCGDSSSNVYAVGIRDGAAGVVARFNGGAWTSETPLGINNVRSCWLESSNVLWAAGTEQVTKWTNGAGSAQGADLTALGALASVQQWFWMFGIAGELHAVGYNECIMSRSAAGTWSLTLNHSTVTVPLSFRAVAGLRSSEVFAAGTPATCLSGGCGNRVWTWNGSQWTLAASLPLLGEVRSSHVVPPNLIYIGGQVDGPGERAAIIRAVRQ